MFKGRLVCGMAVLSLLAIPLDVRGQGAVQASITGVVRDTSGAVLPGVTVEASSPALIEKSRSAVTDGTGRYQIVSLPPGAYTVTFTLAGFSTVQREGLQLSGSLTATIDAEMRLGSLEETITVSGESPIVDVQSVKQQRVIDREPTRRRSRAACCSSRASGCSSARTATRVKTSIAT